MGTTTVDLKVTASLAWSEQSTTRMIATLTVDGASVLLQIVLDYLDEHPDIEPGWCYYDGESYFRELAVEGSELEQFISAEINRKLGELNQ